MWTSLAPTVPSSSETFTWLRSQATWLVPFRGFTVAGQRRDLTDFADSEAAADDRQRRE